MSTMSGYFSVGSKPAGLTTSPSTFAFSAPVHQSSDVAPTATFASSPALACVSRAARRVLRRRVGARARGDPLGGPARDRHSEEVRVRGDLRMRLGIAGEYELLTVLGDVELIAAADGERRGVEGTRGEVARRSGER